MDKRILVLAGGTGGHVYPALAVAKHLSILGHQVSWMGTRSGLEGRVVPQNGVPIDWISVSGIRGKRGLDRVRAPLLLLWACCQAGLILYRRKPHVVIGMGGFVSGPGGLMAWLMRIPLVIHEQNSIPGTTNRLLAWLAKRVLEAFPGSFTGSVHAVCTGNPVRLNITRVQRTSIVNLQRPLRILVLGGSQGARTLNSIVPRVVGELSARVDVFHQSGTAMLEQTSKAYQSLAIDAKVESFVEDMRVVYRWADLAICRSGAMTISELAIVGLAAILIPYPFAIDDHQTQNARFLVDAGAALMILEGDGLQESLRQALSELVSDPGRISSMARCARELGRPESTELVSEHCLEVAA